MPTQEILDQEVEHVVEQGVEHVEVALNMGLKFESLEETHDRLMTRLNFSKIKLEEFKFKFPI